MYATTPPRVPVPPPRPSARPHRPDCSSGVVPRLRTVIAAEHGFDLAALRARPTAPVTAPAWLDLLGAASPAPIRTAADALDRVDALARDMVGRMTARGWDESAAPEAVTSVLAASVPAAEAVLLHAARSRRA